MKNYWFLMLALTGCLNTTPSKRIEFEAYDTYPEGIVYDKTSDAFYVSSVRTGTIGKVTPQGIYNELYTDSTLKSTYGIKIHPDGKRLFACAGDANYSKYTSADTRQKMARLISVDLTTGKLLSNVDLATLVEGKHFANDLVFDPQGNIYITDSFAHAIYKVTPEGKASVFAKDKQFETEGVGLNGIVYHPDGFLLVSNSNKGRIYKVDVTTPQKVQKVIIEPYFLGADGLVLSSKDELAVVVNGGNDKIFRLVTDNNWQSAKLAATTLAVDRFAYPATATLKDQEIWIMNAKFNELADSNSVPSRKFSIQLVPFKPIPSKP